ncbi:hypothetical protein AB1Y20_008964 [Prymnesium parvum]|uniref:Protein xylosyltransferase n=1 Tax=Prymnesium parvum TaxID=97485 RepID=A0AB34K2W6_PRYPA
MLRAAYVMHGKLGGIDRGTGAAVRAVDGASPGLDLLVLCFASVWRHVLVANRERFHVDLIGHSWNPSVGGAIDALFRPRRSAHEPEAVVRNRALCYSLAASLRHRLSSSNRTFAHYGAVGRGASSCERTASHLLGMQRAIELKAAVEKEGGFTYDVVVVARWDVVWNRPLDLGGVEVRRAAFTLPSFCTATGKKDPEAGMRAAHADFRRAACGGLASGGQVPTAAISCGGTHRPCMPDLSAEARELFLLDWWFGSSSRLADRFAEVASEKEYARYSVLNFERLTASPSPVMMGHAFWGMKMMWGLSASLIFSAHLQLDFSLGRMWQASALPRGVKQCRVLRTRCSSPLADTAEGRRLRASTEARRGSNEGKLEASGKGGGGGGGRGARNRTAANGAALQSMHACTADDVVRRPWQAPLVTPRPRPRPTFRYNNEQSHHSCDDGWFLCEEYSRACKEQEPTLEPMDRPAQRAQWIACTSHLCERLRLPKNSAGCAGALLKGWVETWSAAPPANDTLARELQASGFDEGGLTRTREPLHAEAARRELSSHAAALLLQSKTTPADLFCPPAPPPAAQPHRGRALADGGAGRAGNSGGAVGLEDEQGRSSREELLAAAGAQWERRAVLEVVV